MEGEIRELADKAARGDRKALRKLIAFRNKYATNDQEKTGVPDRLVVWVAACGIPRGREACGLPN